MNNFIIYKKKMNKLIYWHWHWPVFGAVSVILAPFLLLSSRAYFVRTTLYTKYILNENADRCFIVGTIKKNGFLST